MEAGLRKWVQSYSAVELLGTTQCGPLGSAAVKIQGKCCPHCVIFPLAPLSGSGADGEGSVRILRVPGAGEEQQRQTGARVSAGTRLQ